MCVFLLLGYHGRGAYHIYVLFAVISLRSPAGEDVLLDFHVDKFVCGHFISSRLTHPHRNSY